MKTTDLTTPHFLDDPQGDTTTPLCEHKNWTEEPCEDVCRGCSVDGCEKRVNCGE